MQSGLYRRLAANAEPQVLEGDSRPLGVPRSTGAEVPPLGLPLMAGADVLPSGKAMVTQGRGAAIRSGHMVHRSSELPVYQGRSHSRGL
jgi:hypothetical protein